MARCVAVLASVVLFGSVAVASGSQPRDISRDAWARQAGGLCKAERPEINAVDRVVGDALEDGDYAAAGRALVGATRLTNRLLARIAALPPPENLASLRKAYVRTQRRQIDASKAAGEALIQGRVGRAGALLDRRAKLDERSNEQAAGLGILKSCEL